MKCAREAFIFLLGAALAALLTILIGRGRSPDFASSIVRSTAEPALSKTIDDVQIDHLTLDQAIAVLSDKAHVPIKSQHRKILEGKGIDPDTRVTLRARQTTLASALREILDPVNALGADLAFWPKENSIWIGSSSDSVVVKIFDLTDLDLHELPDSTPNDRGLSGNGNSQGQTLNVAWPQFDELAKLIEESVAPDTWRDSGGTIGSLFRFDSKLVVVQTWESQQFVASLLHDLAPTSTGRSIDRRMESMSPSQLYLWNAELNQFVPVTESPADAALRRQLPEVDISQRKLGEALQMLGEQAHVALVVNWNFLETIGHHPDELVTLKARQVTLASVLRQLLYPMDSSQIGIKSEGTSIFSGMRGNSLSSRVYDLGAYFDAQLDDQSKRERCNAIIRTIEGTIGPPNWVGNGGDDAISVFDSKLVVTADWTDQEEILALLADLHRSPATQPASR